MGKTHSIRSKITASAILCFSIGMLIVLLTLFFYLRSAFGQVTREAFKEEGYKYSNMIKDQFENPVSFLAGVTGMAEAQIRSGNTDREALQQLIYGAYDNYPISEGSAFMMEPNAYDGKDRQYVGTEYGTVYTGRISYYYWRENGVTQFLPQTEDDELEFVQPYYVTSKERKVPTFSEPYVYTVAGNSGYMITASHPMLDDSNNVLGIMTVDLYLTSIHEMMSSEQIYDTGYMVLVSEDGKILYSPNLDLVGKDAGEEGLLYEQPGNGEEIRYSQVASYINGKNSIVATIPVELELADSKFYVSIIAPNSEVNAVYIRLMIIMVVIFVLIGVAIALAIGSIVGKTMGPLGLMTRFLKQVGETGNLSFGQAEWEKAREASKSGDEIGQSMTAFMQMLEQFVYYGECLQTVSSGDLTVDVHTLGGSDTCGVALRDMVRSLNDLFGDIHISAMQVATGSRQIDNASQNLATGTSQQAAAIAEFTTRITHILNMADKNASTANVTLNSVQETEQMMNNCTDAMEQMLGAMQDIDHKSQSISKVIKVIDDIAFQTNILALNAAVEAARAGQHGKGFAVVADEVRNLASKSAEAARETAQLIESSSHSVAEGNSIVDKVNANLRAVNDISAKSAGAIRELNTASLDQKDSISEIRAAIDQLSAVVQQNSATAEETAASSEEMSTQSQLLNRVIEQFKLKKMAREQKADQELQYDFATGFSLDDSEGIS